MCPPHSTGALHPHHLCPCHLLQDPHRPQELEQLHVETQLGDPVDSSARREAPRRPLGPLRWRQPQTLGPPVPPCTGSAPCSQGHHGLVRCLQGPQAGVPQTRDLGDGESSPDSFEARLGSFLPWHNSCSSRGSRVSHRSGLRRGKTQAAPEPRGEETSLTRCMRGELWFLEKEWGQDVTGPRRPGLGVS